MSGATRSRVLVLLGAAILVLAGALPASSTPGVQVVASGLDNPED